MNLTDKVVIGLILIAVLWETWTIVNKAPHDTISESIWRAIRRHPVIIFISGGLAGHWFFCACATGAF